jgi:DNA-binding response OmpR family regulator
MATKILIIEDNPQIADVICLAFEIGWPEAEVTAAPSGEEGLEISRRDLPDVVILDLGLPDISGFEVLRRLRRFSNTPVLVLSAMPYEDSAPEAFKYEADVYMTKPFRSAELLERSRALLPVELSMSK